MNGLRITKIVCPSCEGTGKFSSVLDVPCMWCRGNIRISVETGHRYADQLYMLAGGGFICGDHEYDDKVEMEKRAETIYSVTGHTPPWRAPKGRSA